jgi:hypothetical protein
MQTAFQVGFFIDIGILPLTAPTAGREPGIVG